MKINNLLGFFNIYPHFYFFFRNGIYLPTKEEKLKIPRRHITTAGSRQFKRNSNPSKQLHNMSHFTQYKTVFSSKERQRKYLTYTFIQDHTNIWATRVNKIKEKNYNCFSIFILPSIFGLDGFTNKRRKTQIQVNNFTI